jgi:hypothetical protein
MSDILDFIVPIIFLVTFPLIWFLIITLLRTKAKMTRHLDINLGTLLKTSSWGSAVINGMSARNSLRVKEYDKGYVLEIMWLLGGGKLWLAKDGLNIGEISKGSFFKPKKLELNNKDNHIILYGNLIKAF